MYFYTNSIGRFNLINFLEFSRISFNLHNKYTVLRKPKSYLFSYWTLLFSFDFTSIFENLVSSKVRVLSFATSFTIYPRVFICGYVYLILYFFSRVFNLYLVIKRRSTAVDWAFLEFNCLKY